MAIVAASLTTSASGKYARSTHPQAKRAVRNDPGPMFWEQVKRRNAKKRPTDSVEPGPMVREEKGEAEIRVMEAAQQHTTPGSGDAGGFWDRAQRSGGRVGEETEEEGEVFAYLDEQAMALHQYKIGHKCGESWECASDLVCMEGVCATCETSDDCLTARDQFVCITTQELSELKHNVCRHKVRVWGARRFDDGHCRAPPEPIPRTVFRVVFKAILPNRRIDATVRVYVYSDMYIFQIPVGA